MTRSSLHFLGTGTAFNTDGRGSQCLLIRPAAAAPYLVDLGPTATAAVERLFVTHLHGDHVAGWPFLLLRLSFVDRRTRPFDVHGPVGLRECLEGLMSHCYPDVLEGPGLGFEVRYHELPLEPGSGLTAGRTEFDVFRVEHHATSLAYRFDVGGRRVGVTGDTRWCAGLEELARASDLLVLECTGLTATEHASLLEHCGVSEFDAV